MIQAIMEGRRQHLHETCEKWDLDTPGNDSLHRPNTWEFLINRPHHLVWCNVFKAASTSWMYNFNVLAGYSPKFLYRTKVVPLQLARKRYPRPTLQELQEALNDSLSFLIVRHPLERLLSAYRDKMQSPLPNTMHQKLGNQIILKYRDANKLMGNRQHVNPRWPTFPEFIRYLTDTFNSGQRYDMHWAPIAEFCTPCQIDFKVIAKFETLQNDQNYIIYSAGLQNVIKPEWKNSAKGRTTSELTSGYYSQLTKRQIRKLHEIYKYDFELFEYSIDEYLRYGIPDKHTSSPSNHKIQQTKSVLPSLRL